ncbi:hypothetical protein IWZ01DRAFT_179843 [Phyllosticta capitalensis]
MCGLDWKTFAGFTAHCSNILRCRASFTTAAAGVGVGTQLAEVPLRNAVWLVPARRPLGRCTATRLPNCLPAYLLCAKSIGNGTYLWTSTHMKCVETSGTVQTPEAKSYDNQRGCAMRSLLSRSVPSRAPFSHALERMRFAFAIFVSLLPPKSIEDLPGPVSSWRQGVRAQGYGGFAGEMVVCSQPEQAAHGSSGMRRGAGDRIGSGQCNAGQAHQQAQHREPLRRECKTSDHFL